MASKAVRAFCASHASLDMPSSFWSSPGRPSQRPLPPPLLPPSLLSLLLRSPMSHEQQYVRTYVRGTTTVMMMMMMTMMIDSDDDDDDDDLDADDDDDTDDNDDAADDDDSGGDDCPNPNLQTFVITGSAVPCGRVGDTCEVTCASTGGAPLLRPLAAVPADEWDAQQLVRPIRFTPAGGAATGRSGRGRGMLHGAGTAGRSGLRGARQSHASGRPTEASKRRETPTGAEAAGATTSTCHAHNVRAHACARAGGNVGKCACVRAYAYVCRAQCWPKRPHGWSSQGLVVDAMAAAVKVPGPWTCRAEMTTARIHTYTHMCRRGHGEETMGVKRGAGRKCGEGEGKPRRGDCSKDKGGRKEGRDMTKGEVGRRRHPHLHGQNRSHHHRRHH